MTCKVDEARLDCLPRNKERITKGALKQHIEQAIFQAGHVWGEATVTMQQLPPLSNWG